MNLTIIGAVLVGFQSIHRAFAFWAKNMLPPSTNIAALSTVSLCFDYVTRVRGVNNHHIEKERNGVLSAFFGGAKEEFTCEEQMLDIQLASAENPAPRLNRCHDIEERCAPLVCFSRNRE